LLASSDRPVASRRDAARDKSIRATAAVRITNADRSAI
jgi:hypothetical protein